MSTKRYAMTAATLAPCNLTSYGEWAAETGFDPGAYASALGGLGADEYWSLMGNASALEAYVASTPLGSLGRYFGTADVGRERCAVPDMHAASWDRSALYACPTLCTLPRFSGAGEGVLSATGHGGGSASPWARDEPADAWYFGVDQTTGYTVTAHKTYQLSNAVARTAHLYPDLWVAPGSSANFSLQADFVLGGLPALGCERIGGERERGREITMGFTCRNEGMLIHVGRQLVHTMSGVCGAPGMLANSGHGTVAWALPPRQPPWCAYTPPPSSFPCLP